MQNVKIQIANLEVDLAILNEDVLLQEMNLNKKREEFNVLKQRIQELKEKSGMVIKPVQKKKVEQSIIEKFLKDWF